MKKKRIILSAGGTGGHLFPAQALAQSLTDYEVLFVGGGLGRNCFFDRTEFAFEEIDSATFSFSKPMQFFRSARRIFKGMQQSRRIIHSFSPDVVVGFGSFYTLPLLLAAKRKKIPIILHEQNAIPGKVNRLFSRFARTTAITFPIQLHGATQLVRFPIRVHEDKDPWKYFGLEKGKPTLLVFGGSLGAVRLNELFLEALPRLSNYQVLHFTGKNSEEIEKYYQKLGIAHYVKSFEPKLHLAMKIADLAITRSGAATIAELTEAEVPAILIPFPYAAENHQEKNAWHFTGAEIYLEKSLTGERLANAITHFPIEEKKKHIQECKQNSNLIQLSDVVQDVVDHG